MKLSFLGHELSYEGKMALGKKSIGGKDTSPKV
jgi:hypothetical protein